MILGSVLSLSAQVLPYEPLLNKGQLPEDVTLTPLEKYEQIKGVNPSGENNVETESFLLETSYLFDNLMRSGYVLFNDSLGEYVNEVLQYIVAENPILRVKNPRAYILKSTEVNAFAIDRGIVFVSLGLLARLENEAQLAFILSHELVHINESHVMDEFLEANRIEEEALGEKLADGEGFELITELKNSYSREQEIEADTYGADFFLHTNYAFEELTNVFELLRYAHLPYADIPFENASLEKVSTMLPAELKLDSVATISVPEEVEEGTHPAISKRKRMMGIRLSSESLAERVQSIISEERFENCRQRARMELPTLYLMQQQLPQAIYTAYLLNQIYGESSYRSE
ncbi:MAG: M48 family metallopeptidase, partial [Bacteroidota bacterium]